MSRRLLMLDNIIIGRVARQRKGLVYNGKVFYSFSFCGTHNAPFSAVSKI